jgi:hypothetical protein
MLERIHPKDRVVTHALKLAQTGEFEDATSIERELISAGFSTFEVLALNAPAVRFMIDGACDSGRRDEQRSAQQR